MAFRYSGKNWEGRAWNTPTSLRSFGVQIDEEYPSRPRTSDGTVASKTHDKVSPSSDHRPRPTSGPGVVRAIDATVTVDQGNTITEALRQSKDKRIKYVIWNRRSFSPPDWTWRNYSGAPHDKHLHLSLWPTQDANDDLWQLGVDDMVWSKIGDPIGDKEDCKAVHAYQGEKVLRVQDVEALFDADRTTILTVSRLTDLLMELDLRKANR